jgi:hypothetical protein
VQQEHFVNQTIARMKQVIGDIQTPDKQGLTQRWGATRTCTNGSKSWCHAFVTIKLLHNEAGHQGYS